MTTFGDRLKKLREEKKMNQQELADFMGKSNKTVISSWELNKNQPTLQEIEKLADYFQTSTDYLIRGKSPVISETNSDYITIPKDELIALQRLALSNQIQSQNN